MNEFFSRHGISPEEIRHHRLKLLVVIVNREHVPRVTEALMKNRSFFQITIMAQGTSTSEIINLLGLGSTDKAMVLCLYPEIWMRQLMEELSENIKFRKAGRGIAFTIPLSGISNPMLKMMTQEMREDYLSEMEKEVGKVRANANFELIVAVINQGYSEELMAAAKTAGATGGTIVNARRTGEDKAINFFGISMQSEKEVVSILAPRDSKHEIMKAITASFGIKSEAHGIVFSLPVEDVEGFEGAAVEDEGKNPPAEA